jgi:hypothetical protein
MTPQLAIFILQEVITQAPALYTDIVGIFSSPTPPTPADWQALLAKITAKSYADYDPGLASAPGAPAATAAAAPQPAANVVTLPQAAAVVTAGASQASTAAQAPLVAIVAAPDQPTAAAGGAATVPAPPTIPTDDAGLAALVNGAPVGELTALFQAGDKLRSLVNARWAAPPTQAKS